MFFLANLSQIYLIIRLAERTLKVEESFFLPTKGQKFTARILCVLLGSPDGKNGERACNGWKMTAKTLLLTGKYCLAMSMATQAVTHSNVTF